MFAGQRARNDNDSRGQRDSTLPIDSIKRRQKGDEKRNVFYSFKGTYKVDLFTEDQFGACTGVNILLTLYGSEGQSDEHCIESEGEHTFKEGM